MVKQPPKNIDVMLMEGSSLGRLADTETFPTEKALERIFKDRFKTTPGMVLVACSAQNIDRVVTIYRAARQTSRTLIVDAYGAEVLKATGNDHIPKPVRGWSDVAVFIPQAQRVHLVTKNIASIVDSYRGFRLWPEELAEQAPRSVMLFRAWMLRDLERARALKGARVIWSQWEGYLHLVSGPRRANASVAGRDRAFHRFAQCFAAGHHCFHQATLAIADTGGFAFLMPLFRATNYARLLQSPRQTKASGFPRNRTFTGLL